MAGELKSPGSYSFRTLEFLKGLSKYEAELINKVAQFVVSNRIFRGESELLSKEGINLENLIFLQEIGFISGVESSGLVGTWKSTENDRYIAALISNTKAIILEHEDINKIAKAEVYVVTSIGEQVLALTSFQPNIEYLESIAKYFAMHGYKVTLADWQQLAEDGRYFNGVEIKA